MGYYSSAAKSIVLFIIVLTSAHQASSQYYYNDIWASREYDQATLFRKNKVARVQLSSFEANGSQSEGFKGNISTNTTYTLITSVTQAAAAPVSVVKTQYSPAGTLQSATDSTTEAVTRYQYQYDTNGRLFKINSQSRSADGKINETEEHEWTYSANGHPTEMLRIRNNNDTTLVRFKLDEHNNVTEETAYKKGQLTDEVYYYYDDNSRITDVVRYNNRLKKLIPDFILEYNNRGQLYQKTTVMRASDYLIWRYEYNEGGLKTRELCYDKQKRLVGRIEYSYQYR